MTTEVMQAGIIIIAVIFVLAGIAAIITEQVLKYRQRQRRNRRLYGFGNVYSQRDFKD